MAVIVLMGPCGSGKTTIGTALMKRTGWCFIEGDDYHSDENLKKLRLGEALTDADRIPWLESLHAVITSEQYKEVTIILACSALKRRYREILMGKNGSRFIFVFLQAPLNVLQSRVGDRISHFIPASLLPSQIDTLEVPTEDESAITIDSTLELEIIISKIIGTV